MYAKSEYDVKGHAAHLVGKKRIPAEQTTFYKIALYVEALTIHLRM